MNKAWIVAIVPGLVTVILLIMILGLLLVKLVWSWTIPDLFPGAVVRVGCTRYFLVHGI